MDTKKCFKCKDVKPLDDFYKHSEMADGHLGKCKDCAKTDATSNRNANLERIRAYDRERGKLPHRIANTIANTKRWRKLNPEKYAAHMLLNYAVRTGKVKKPRKCSQCKKKRLIMGHHEDYTKPLEVIWACQECHKEIESR